MTLRELRLWHWKRVLDNRGGAQRTAADIKSGALPDEKWLRDTIKAYHSNANFHLKAVVALNDLFPEIGDTAESDHFVETLK